MKKYIFVLLVASLPFLPACDSGNGPIYQSGYDSGYEDGRREGRSDGYEEGYEAGYETGLDNGYGEGYYDLVEELVESGHKEIVDELGVYEKVEIYLDEDDLNESGIPDEWVDAMRERAGADEAKE